MAGVQYLCVYCESTHEIAKRADGPVYLRCPTTYRWAWYDARAFDAARAGGRGKAPRAAKTAAGSTAGSRRTLSSPSAGRRRTSSRPKAAAKKGRAAARSSARSSARKSPRKRGRR
jgi:hypothetical protein